MAVGIHDTALLSVARSHEDMESLLNRKTDLFCVMNSPADKSGFLPGRAEEMVLNAFRMNSKLEDSSTVSSRETVNQSTLSTPNQSISTWNGGMTGKYRWTQSITDITVEVSLTEHLPRKKDLVVNFTSQELVVRIGNSNILSGVFSERINSSESTWQLEDGTKVLLHLEKSREAWWKCFLIGDDEIDTTKVDSTKRIQDYDPETQGAIRKILFDQNQQRQGLPTSDEARMNELLATAYSQPSCPFKD